MDEYAAKAAYFPGANVPPPETEFVAIRYVDGAGSGLR